MAVRLVVEWTRSSLRVAVCEGGGGRFRLRAVHAQPLPATGEVVPALRELLSRAGVLRADAVGVIPREQVLTRVVKFPSTKTEELAAMVELYAKGQLPYSKEQAVTNFHVVQQGEGFSTVAIVACRRETVDHMLSTLREAELTPVALTVSSWGVVGWYRQAVILDASREPALVVNVDDARTDFVVAAEGRLLTSRSIGQGAQDWSGMVDAAELLALEAERTRAAVQKELPETDVRSVIVTGSGELTRWSEILGTRMSLPAEAIEPPPASERSGANVAVSAVVVSGLAGSQTGELLNLGPPELRAHVRHRQQVRELAALGLLIVGVLALGAGLLAVQGVREQHRAAQVDSILVDAEPRAKRVREKLRMTQMTDAVLSHRRQLATVLSGVLRATPPTVTLEGLSFERGRSEMELRGNADSTQTILDYAKALEQVEDIAAVELKRSSRRLSPSGDRADFELLVRVRPASADRTAAPG